MTRYVMPNGVDSKHLKNSGVHVQIIQAAVMPISAWAGGETRQLAIFPVSATVAAQDFQWRLSAATVLQDGAFTLFPKHQRLLALRQGAGFRLQVDAQQLQVRSPRQVLRFAGGAQSYATLIAGAVVDINLMVDASLQANLWSARCTTEYQPWPGPCIPGATLLIYADQAPLLICLAPDEPPLQLAHGDVLQLQSLSQPCFIRAADAPCTAVFAWLAPV